jgi:hypothetical protein
MIGASLRATTIGVVSAVQAQRIGHGFGPGFTGLQRLSNAFQHRSGIRRSEITLRAFSWR